MKKNYKLQNTNYKQTTNYKIQITNKVAPFGHIINVFGERDAHELHELTRNKGSHGLHQDTFTLQTMTALIKSFCRGLFAKRKAEGAKRIIQLTLCAKRQALCAFPLAAGGT